VVPIVSDSDPAPIQAALRESPSLYPLQFTTDHHAVLFVRLSESDYANASFLDARDLRQECPRGVIPWEVLEPLRRQLPLHCDFLFHISHCGSTLMARLLGLRPECFPLREPWLLRQLGQGLPESKLEILLKLWSRVFRPSQKSLIKTTSFVSEHGAALMRAVPHSKSLLMAIPAENFIASVLDGSMSDIESQSRERLARLQQRGWLSDTALDTLSPGEKCAMNWLCEWTSLKNIHQAFPDRTCWIDFETFLNDLGTEFDRVLDFFAIPKTHLNIEDHAILKQYAKRPNVHYDAHFRSHLLDTAKSQHASEIAQGLRWLERQLRDDPRDTACLQSPSGAATIQPPHGAADELDRFARGQD
jgi:hypothetical protein